MAALFYGEARAEEEQAKKLVRQELGEYIAEALTDFSSKGKGSVVPTDPLLFRFYEILQVYGMPMKAVIYEKFGDGTMSAVGLRPSYRQRETDPRGDRVKLPMSGKFLHTRSF